MLRNHTTTALAVGLIGSILFGGSPSFGQEPPGAEEPPLEEEEPPIDEPPVGKPAIASVSPSGGAAGSTVTISGDSCLAGNEPGLLNFGFTRDGVEVDFTTLDGYPANEDGTWAIDTTVPTRMRGPEGLYEDVEPGAGYQFLAVCVFGGSPDLWVWYDPMPFEVVAPSILHPTDPNAPGTPGSPGFEASSTTATLSPATAIEGTPPFTG